MTDLLISRAGLFFGLSGSVFIFLSFFIYIFNRKKYDNLISLFLKSHQFPPPYSFYHMMGFFGAYQTCRFFIKLSTRKKMLFFSLDSPAYKFFAENGLVVEPWMINLSRLWMYAGIFYCLTAVSALILFIIR